MKVNWCSLTWPEVLSKVIHTSIPDFLNLRRALNQKLLMPISDRRREKGVDQGVEVRDLLLPG